jgi:RimJ/RimL family protein N-acetyltransferase
MPVAQPDAPPLLGDDVLARRSALPLKPAAVELEAGRVSLRPLDLAADCDALYAASCGAPFGGKAAFDAEEMIWRWMNSGPFADTAALRAWLAGQDAAPDGRPFAVRADGVLVGVANLIANQPAHLKIELGSIWYAPAVQGRGVSRAVTRMLLAHCFALGYRRVEWKCDALNVRSRSAALSYGFVFEGVQQAHYIVKGRNRDTAWFRLLAAEWS